MIICSYIDKFYRKLIHQGIEDQINTLHLSIGVKSTFILRVEYQLRHTLNV